MIVLFLAMQLNNSQLSTWQSDIVQLWIWIPLIVQVVISARRKAAELLAPLPLMVTLWMVQRGMGSAAMAAIPKSLRMKEIVSPTWSLNTPGASGVLKFHGG
jgi:hypothetical protein